jgi:hypothetical protein
MPFHVSGEARNLAVYVEQIGTVFVKTLYLTLMEEEVWLIPEY